MNELKPLPCPICGAELKIYGPEDWVPTFYDPDSGGDPYAANCDCGFSFQRNDYDYAEFIAALNRRAKPTNAPLTLEELREMSGDFVTIRRFKNAGTYTEYQNTVAERVSGDNFFHAYGVIDIRDYGKAWVALSRKPEPEGGDR